MYHSHNHARQCSIVDQQLTLSIRGGTLAHKTRAFITIELVHANRA
jgi:hypothetical protein